MLAEAWNILAASARIYSKLATINEVIMFIYAAMGHDETCSVIFAVDALSRWGVLVEYVW